MTNVPGRSATASRSARVTVWMCATGAGCGRADRPHRLVGDDDPAVRRTVERVAELGDRARGGFGRLDVLVLADAQHRPEAVAQRGGGLGAHDLVGLAEEPAALGVSDLDHAHTDLGELRRADLTGEGAEILGRGILRSDDGVRSRERLERCGDLQVGGDDEELDGAVGDSGVPGDDLRDAREPGVRLEMPEVHLEAHADGHAGRHQQLPVCSYRSRSATFSAEADVGSKR